MAGSGTLQSSNLGEVRGFPEDPSLLFFLLLALIGSPLRSLLRHTGRQDRTGQDARSIGSLTAAAADMRLFLFKLLASGTLAPPPPLLAVQCVGALGVVGCVCFSFGGSKGAGVGGWMRGLPGPIALDTIKTMSTHTLINKRTKGKKHTYTRPIE